MINIRMINSEITAETHAKISRVLQLRKINLNEARYGTSQKAIDTRKSIKAILEFDNVPGIVIDKYLDIYGKGLK